MRLSREKINHLSKLILRGFLEDDRLEFFCDENDLRLEIVNILRTELEIEEDIDSSVRKMIESYSKDIREGTDEWDILYHKHYNEETKKRRGISL
ncbi:hypothetical protein MNBD_NITROSPINAE03-304 [hydrothermal vent metagenome]|uniref:DUF507 domain-containing protein n=1 Tax=hydrothermal vent metagenome TaxID=652676 RepID=A0A3B1CCH4_9ZZZZ|nr:DUF507 family protein [Nitrospirota bacterium]